MSKEKAFKKLQEFEKNRFKITGKKFNGKTWFDALLENPQLESQLDLFLHSNSKFFGDDCKAKEIERVVIEGKPAIEIKYTMPNDNEVYSAFFGEFCHYTPLKNGEFKPVYSFQKNENGRFILPVGIHIILSLENGQKVINNRFYSDALNNFNILALQKMGKQRIKQQMRLVKSSDLIK